MHTFVSDIWKFKTLSLDDTNQSEDIVYMRMRNCEWQKLVEIGDLCDSPFAIRFAEIFWRWTWRYGAVRTLYYVTAFDRNLCDPGLKAFDIACASG